jgi:alkanesulfonate monooxygenase SsuD/methylene tetrahydromethanopterin reductase-like flavin-dependent oxidoreductase (luciferase family)
MVARVADWWFLDFDKTARTTADVEDSLRRSIDGMRERMAKLGRRVRFAFNPFVAFGPSREQAEADARRLLMPDEPDGDFRKIENRIAPAMMAGCVGHPDQVREQVMKYAEMGIELLLLKFPPTVVRVEEIRREIVVPLQASSVRAAE